jgi:nicotinamidase-related amidase
MTPRTALLVIDAQVNMFDPALPAHGAEALLPRLVRLVERARAAGMPVVFIRNCGGPGDPDERDTPGWQLHPALPRQDGDPLFDKSTTDAFASTPLAGALAARGVTRLVVAGLQSEHCVRATTLGALQRGFEVTLVADAHATYDAAGRSAAAISAGVNAELAGRAAVVSAEALSLP